MKLDLGGLPPRAVLVVGSGGGGDGRSWTRRPNRSTSGTAAPEDRGSGYASANSRTGGAARANAYLRGVESAYRRHKARREFLVLLRKHYAAGLGDAKMRRRFLNGQAADKAAELAAVLEGRGDSIDRLFHEFDQGLAFSRQVFGQSAPAGTRSTSERGSLMENSSSAVDTSSGAAGVRGGEVAARSGGQDYC
eukprot:jgi/Undpi1/4679/HiC_scaffold_18.g08033.m1